MNDFSTIQQLAALSGNSKQRLLRDSPELMKILYYTYNPFMRYHITVSRTMYGKGIDVLDETAFTLLDKLASRELSGKEARQVVHTFISGLAENDAEVFKMMLSKDLRAGVSIKTVNKVWPNWIPVHDVMLAKTYCLVNKTGREMMKSPKITRPTWTSPKIDGLRGKLTEGKLFTRNGHEILGCGHIGKLLQHGYDGEVVIPGVDFYRSSGFIRDHKQHPNAEYHIFDAPSVKEPFIRRLDYISEIVKNINDPRIKMVPHTLIDTHEEAIIMYNNYRLQGFEGSMIKPIDYQYVGSRSKSWLKIKNFDTYDLKVVGFYEGKGKYEGNLGGIIVDYKGVEVKVGGGFSDLERKVIYENPEDTVGKIVEVHSHEVTPEGSLREPRFKGWRFDKDV